MSDSFESNAHPCREMPPIVNRNDAEANDCVGPADAEDGSCATTQLVCSGGTETLDVNRLVSPEISHSGSFHLTGLIWTTTFGKLLQALPVMTFLVDRSSRIVAANSACDRLSPDYNNAIGTPFSSLVHDPATARELDDAIAEVFSTRKQTVVNTEVGISQHRIWGRLTFRSIRLGVERMIMVIVEDLTSERQQILSQQKHNEALTKEITRREIAEQELLASEKRYRQVVEAANDLIYTTDVHGTFTYLNPLALSKSGYTMPELAGQRFVMVIHPEYREKVNSWYNTQFSERISQTYYEFPILAKTGKTVWLGQNVQLLIKDGRVAGFQAIARDITDRKMAEEQLRASLKEKEVLMREIHHRVKNNLQVISALLTLQADHVLERKPLDVLAGTNARIRAMALVHEKLYESGNMAQIRIDEYLADLVRELLGFGQGIGAEIALQMCIEPLYFDLDTAIPIGLMVAELFTNSIQHAFPHGGAGLIKICLKPIEGDEFELLVCDNGVGIPETVEMGKNQSLGLDLVTAFARKLRGNIHLDASAGTEFSIRFKRAEV